MLIHALTLIETVALGSFRKALKKLAYITFVLSIHPVSSYFYEATPTYLYILLILF